MRPLRRLAPVRLAPVLLAALLVAGCRPDGAPTEAGAPADPALRDELVAMAAADSAARAELDGLVSEGALRTPAFARRAAATDSLTARHAARLRAILEAHGWPTPNLVGAQGAAAALRLAEAAERDTALQAVALPLLERAHRRGDVPGPAVAHLTDRALRARGLPQRYGTQADVRRGGLDFGALEDSAGVDRRRARLGLPPLAAYADSLRALYRLAPE